MDKYSSVKNLPRNIFAERDAMALDVPDLKGSDSKAMRGVRVFKDHLPKDHISITSSAVDVVLNGNPGAQSSLQKLISSRAQQSRQKKAQSVFSKNQKAQKCKWLACLPADFDVSPVFIVCPCREHEQRTHRCQLRFLPEPSARS